ncbi:MAG: HlyD family efflux transporter periplasmic adaptor subunit [Oscillospiraceae bacterium]|nr:HlyD family efflux transporter periplasmic adaptor subunit [Oscillospiraceae bacterium]
MNLKLPYRIIMLILPLIIIASCSGPAAQVRTATAEKGDIYSYLSTTGTIMTVNRQVYGYQGQVDKVSIGLGDRVEQDDVLVTYRNGYVMRAGFGGTITALNVSDGMIDTATQPAVILEDLDDLKVQIRVGKTSIGQIKTGQKVIVTEKTDIDIESEISFISPVASAASSSSGANIAVVVEYSLGEHSQHFLAGFDIEADILIDTAEDVLKIPGEAVMYEAGGQTYVYTVENSRAKKVFVEIGIDALSEVEILSGLSAGDVVILGAGSGITEGIMVKQP